MAKLQQNMTAYDKAVYYLRCGRLNETCAFLSLQFASHNAYALVDETKTLQEDYQRMLSFMWQGSDDPHRAEVYDRLRERAWTLAERLYDLDHPQSEEISRAQIESLLATLGQKPHHDEAINAVFEYVAESHHLSHDERRSLHQALLDEQLPDYVRATLLGAMTLHLFQWFNAEMVENLYMYTFDDQPQQLRMQAWVTLVFVALIHKDRLRCHPRLREQYAFMAESEPDLFFSIQIALLQCREAYSFNKKLHEIIDPDGDKAEPTQDDVKELLQFISEGVDMSLTSFSQIKKLDFFSQPGTRHHWFEPFSLEQSYVREVLDKHPEATAWTRMMMQSVAQCETDKYGAFVCMQKMDERLMTIISQKLEEKGLRFEDILPLPPLYVMRNYLHDLFRYCNMHPQARNLRTKPFDGNLLLFNDTCLKSIFDDTEKLRKTAEFLFRKEHWKEAEQAYRALCQREVSEQTLQRLAYCILQLGTGGNEAQEVLQRCNQLFTGNKWTEKRLADLYHQSRNLVSEELCLHEALTHHPDDSGLLMRLGRCLNQQKRPNEALKPLYQADLQKEGQLNVQRELARALLMTHDLEGAERYAQQLLSRKRLSADERLLCGHIALAAGHLELAIKRYSTHPDDLRNALDRNDIDYEAIGIDPEQLQIIYDALQTSE